MYFIEINYPGTWLKFSDAENISDVKSLLDGLEKSATEAAISLSMFESSRGQIEDFNVTWQRDAELKRAIGKELQKTLGEYYYDDKDYYLIVKREMIKRKVALGILPRSYISRIPFIHAHTFLYAIDSFGKFLEQLATYENVPTEVKNCVNDFNRLFPTVKKIRNSALHIEDRSRGYGNPNSKKNGIRMETNGFLGLSNIEGNSLCYTIDDGSYQQFEISYEVLSQIVHLANYVVSCFEWEGPADIKPEY